MELVIFRKDFVPVLKPMEMHLVPSKLRLNNIHFKHHKKNRNLLNCISCPCSEDENDFDKELDISNSSDMSDISDLSNNINNNNNINNINENGLKEIRKKFIKIKSGSIHKVMTKKNLKNKKLSKQFDCFDNQDVEEEEEDECEKNKYEDEEEEESNSFDLYEEKNNFINYSIQPSDNKGLKYKQAKSSKNIKNYDDITDEDINDGNNDNKKNINYHKKRSRIYSFTILDTLRNRLKIDK